MPKGYWTGTNEYARIGSHGVGPGSLHVLDHGKPDDGLRLF